MSDSTQPILLGVNVDHCATVRQARYRSHTLDHGDEVEPKKGAVYRDILNLRIGIPAVMQGDMARSLRIERENGLYHVINRGNYRQDLFVTEGAHRSFEKCLFEACEKCGWILEGFCVRSGRDCAMWRV